MLFLKSNLGLLLITMVTLSCGGDTYSESQTSDDPVLDIHQLFDDERFPNITVAMDGTILATFGGTRPASEGHLKIRRSEDGGISWTEFLEDE